MAWVSRLRAWRVQSLGCARKHAQRMLLRCFPRLAHSVMSKYLDLQRTQDNGPNPKTVGIFGGPGNEAQVTGPTSEAKRRTKDLLS